MWLALLLKRQKRANILPPPWLHPESLNEILELETIHFIETFSPAPPPTEQSLVRSTDPSTGKPFCTSHPFLSSCVSDMTLVPENALPYHWLEVSELLLDGASDDLVDPDSIRRLLKDIREIRLAKLRKGVDVLSGEGEGLKLDGVGAMEIAESRGFITGVVDGLRRIGASREMARREREMDEEDDDGGGGGRRRYGDIDDDDEMDG